MSENGVDRTFMAERPKTFNVQGFEHTFRLRVVHPEDWAQVIREVDESERPDDVPTEVYFSNRDKLVSLSLAPEDHAKWQELRKAKLIDWAGLDELLGWLREVHTGRPPTLEQPSSTGPGSTAVPSKAASSSPGVTRAG